MCFTFEHQESLTDIGTCFFHDAGSVPHSCSCPRCLARFAWRSRSRSVLLFGVWIEAAFVMGEGTAS